MTSSVADLCVVIHAYTGTYNGNCKESYARPLLQNNLSTVLVVVCSGKSSACKAYWVTLLLCVKEITLVFCFIDQSYRTEPLRINRRGTLPDQMLLLSPSQKSECLIYTEL